MSSETFGPNNLLYNQEQHMYLIFGFIECLAPAIPSFSQMNSINPGPIPDNQGLLDEGQTPRSGMMFENPDWLVTLFHLRSITNKMESIAFMLNEFLIPSLVYSLLVKRLQLREGSRCQL